MLGGALQGPFCSLTLTYITSFQTQTFLHLINLADHQFPVEVQDLDTDALLIRDQALKAVVDAAVRHVDAVDGGEAVGVRQIEEGVTLLSTVKMSGSGNL